MSFQVKAIGIYSERGELRTVNFRLGAVNVLTGASSTGKSALIEIIDYCLGRSTFRIPEGVIRDSVAWYAVLFSLPGTEVLVAKPAPLPNADSQSRAYYEVGKSLALPQFNQLVPNTTDEAVISAVSGLLGMLPNETEVPPEQTRSSIRATVRHTTFYLFQPQGIIANQDLLFFRQGEQHLPQAMKDTLPYLLGAVRDDRLRLVHEMREARRQLKVLEREWGELQGVVGERLSRAVALVNEAVQAGIVNAPGDLSSLDAVLTTLRTAQEWKPSVLPSISGDRSHLARAQLAALRGELQARLERLDAAEGFAHESDRYSSEAAEQVSRLEIVDLIPLDPKEAHECPLCKTVAPTGIPSIKAIRDSLRDLRENLETVAQETPRLRDYIVGLRGEAEAIREQIRQAQFTLEALTSEQEAARELQDANSRAARVIGRVSLYLETLRAIDAPVGLRRALDDARIRVERLEELIGEGDSEDVEASILNRLSQQMTKWGRSLHFEHSEWPLRFDPERLTVIADRPGRPIPMQRMGGGENWLGCHLTALLALHWHFVREGRPVPSFLVLDQPSQVYFPSMEAYRELAGDEDRTIHSDADLEAVERMFGLLFRVVKELSKKFQIIVLEHANFPDQRFKRALIEKPWVDGRALVPEDWTLSK